MRELPWLTQRPAVGPEAAGADLARLVRERAEDIAVRWRQSLSAAAASSGDRDLIDVVFLVALAAERPDDLDGIRRGAGESVVAVPADLPQALRKLGLLRGVLSDVLTEQDADPSLRPRIDEAVDSIAEAAAAVTTDRLHEVAFADPLTRLPNRRALDRDLTREIARATRGRLGLTAVVGDLDGLKQINDSLGHAAGDRTLQALADALRRAVRGEDCAYRIGGDEFVVLLPGASCADAESVMARAKGAGAPEFSWGAATFPGDGTDGAAVLEVADRRLLDSRATPRHPSASGPRRGPVDWRRLRRGRQVAGLAAVMLGGAVLGGGGVAAADGTLPSPVQHVVHVALDRLRVDVPPATERPRQPGGQRQRHLDTLPGAGHDPGTGAGARPVPLPGPAEGGPCARTAGPAGEEVTGDAPDGPPCGGPSSIDSASSGAQAEKPVRARGSAERGSDQGHGGGTSRTAGDATENVARDGVKSGGDRTAAGDGDRKPAGTGAGGGQDAPKSGGTKGGPASSR